MATAIDLIPNNLTIQLTDVSSGDVLGYGFGMPGVPSLGEAQQVQRWIIRTRDRSAWFPHTDVRMEYPLDTQWQHTTLNAFLSMVKWVFQSDRDLYVKANCKAVTGVERLDSGELLAPAFLSPDPDGAPQADIGTCQVRQGYPVGYLTTIGINTVKRVEYWALFERYQQPGAADATGGRVESVAQRIPVASDFGDLMNGGLWTASSTLVVAACGYYPSLPTPL